MGTLRCERAQSFLAAEATFFSYWVLSPWSIQLAWSTCKRNLIIKEFHGCLFDEKCHCIFQITNTIQVTNICKARFSLHDLSSAWACVRACVRACVCVCVPAHVHVSKHYLMYMCVVMQALYYAVLVSNILWSNKIAHSLNLFSVNGGVC